MSIMEFTYTTRIATTPEQLWAALTQPEFTRRYWFGVAMHSDWRVGSPVKWQNMPEEEPQDLGQVVLAADPYRVLSYSWHLLQPAHAMLFGWSDAELAEYMKEPRTMVTFEIAPDGAGAVRLTVTHDGFEPGSVMYQAISGQLPGSGGWPGLMNNLKALLETGTVLAATPSAAHAIRGDE
ncbi:SRPBCC family protein, partial [Nocardia vulneris]|uniref:SRPBCC family protein n=1 Tax=Nocardia vulneris TaxID=1141657 RepID=UPI0005BA66DE